MPGIAARRWRLLAHPRSLIGYVIEVLTVLQREPGKLVYRIGDSPAREGCEVLIGPGCSGGLIDAVHIVSGNVVDIHRTARSGREGHNLFVWHGAFRLLRQVGTAPFAIVGRGELNDVTVAARDEVNPH